MKPITLDEILQPAKRWFPMRIPLDESLPIELRTNVIERWKATSPGWQTRIAELLSKLR